jgi:DNA transposition AAA+ family ATPase
MKPVFVMTENVRKFARLMDQVKKRMGTDSLAMVSGRAGRGKTRTCVHYATQNDDVALVQTLRDWSVCWMLHDILTALGVPGEVIPKRKKDLFEKLIDVVREGQKVIILDEADLLGLRLMETVRDICKLTLTPIVLVGEESLPLLMDRNRRVWSRRCAALEFNPITEADIICLARDAASLEMDIDAAVMLKRITDGGDIRLVNIALAQLEGICKANNTHKVKVDLVKSTLPDISSERRVHK